MASRCHLYPSTITAGGKTLGITTTLVFINTSLELELYVVLFVVVLRTDYEHHNIALEQIN